MTVKSTAAALGLALVASSAGAQAAASKCDISSAGSPQIAAASEALGRYNTASAPAEKRKFLAAAVKGSSVPSEKATNEPARNWILAQALVAFALEPDQPLEGKRADFGFASNPEAPVAIMTVADSALDVVEAAKPGCANDVEQLRRLAHTAAANSAVELFNAGKLPAADAAAKSALAVHPKGAVAYQIVGNVAVQNKNEAEAIEAFKHAAENAAGDSTLNVVRENALINLAYLTQNKAEAAQGDAQKQLASEAAGYFREYLKLKPDDSNAQSGLARALSASGDSVAIGGLYAQMIADPSKYSDAQLIDAGVGAINAERPQDAIKLLEAGLQRNPNFRDAIYALAIAYGEAAQHDKAVEAWNRMLALDPNSLQGYAALANGYSELLATATDKAQKKTYQDAYLKALDRQNKLAAAVKIDQFAVRGKEHVLAGSVENRTDAEGKYTLKVEVLDKAGNVVATKETPLTAAPKATVPFSVSADNAGIVAYRYAPLGS
jgi:tetratricopeptide (TPR) repeat protein